MRDNELLSAAIASTGLSVRAFARDVLIRDWRTVFRWLAGVNSIGEPLAMPVIVREKCEAILASTRPPPASGDQAPP